ncbi:MAG: hypothetical protein R3C32_06165 [Chloroflexota bacterium]
MERNVEIAMDALRCRPTTRRSRRRSRAARKRRVALCRLLLQHPDLLLLDEGPPTTLDAESVEWLGRFLAEHSTRSSPSPTTATLPGQRLRQWILELDHGRGILQRQLLRMAGAEARAHGARAATSGRQARTLARELEWVRLSPQARQAKGKARLSAYTSGSCRRPRTSSGWRASWRSRSARASRLGEQVIDVAGLRKGFLATGCSSRTSRSRCRGRASSASSGPTARARPRSPACSWGWSRRTRGTIDIGATVVLSRGPGARRAGRRPDGVPGDRQGAEVIKVNTREVPARAYVSSFNFGAPTRSLWASCRAAKAQPRPPHPAAACRGRNVLLLDEPTNDLDVDTLRAGGRGLESFPSCAVVISHDPLFLDRIATHILAFEGDSQSHRFFRGT